jgi:hypothetical protein
MLRVHNDGLGNKKRYIRTFETATWNVSSETGWNALFDTRELMSSVWLSSLLTFHDTLILEFVTVMSCGWSGRLDAKVHSSSAAGAACACGADAACTACTACGCDGCAALGAADEPNPRLRRSEAPVLDDGAWWMDCWNWKGDAVREEPADVSAAKGSAEETGRAGGAGLDWGGGEARLAITGMAFGVPKGL